MNDNRCSAEILIPLAIKPSALTFYLPRVDLHRRKNAADLDQP